MGPTMTRITLVSVLILWAAARQGRGDETTEKGLSLLGYHLCNYTLTKSVFKMVTYQESYEKNTSCGGWIPWMVCPRTHYRTQFHMVRVPETITLTDCCEGYEQVGLYCSLALNRSSVFSSRPGICPVKDMETSDFPCTFDTECPGLKKCCSSSKGAGCVDPMPEGMTFWYNVTVLVKMDFNELIRVDSHLLNHSRLLHSMITGALQHLNTSVHHIQSNCGEIYAGTVPSQVLLGMHHPAPLAEVSSSLKAMVKRVYEVIDTEVQDVNECSYAEFNACPEKSSCVNLEGHYSCHPQHERAGVTPPQLSPRKEGIAAFSPSSAVNAVNTGSSSPSVRKSSLLSITNQSTNGGCYPSAVTNHRILSVTSNSFEMSWLVSSTLNHTFQVRVLKGNETVQTLKTEEMQIDVSHLEAGVMYSVEISYETCGKTIISRQNVKTEAKIFAVTMRILNYNFTDDFHNSSSSAYEEFSRLLLTELENSFPPNISALYKSGKLKMKIESLAAGSIIVRLRITVQDPEFPVDASSFAPVLSYLHNGSVLVVDEQNTAVEDWDECASQAENDCSVFAECINLMGSYLCRTKTTVDTNPTQPGRNCEGEIVDPLTETMAPEIRNSTDFTLEEGSPAGPAPTATSGTVAAADPESSTVTLLPAAVLPLGDKQASHSPTSAPPTPWEKGLAPQMGFSRDSSPTATGVTPSGALAVGTEATSPSQQSSVAKAALPNVPMGTARQEQLSSVWLSPNQTASAATRTHTGGGPDTALLGTGNIPTLNATLRADGEVGREKSSWSEEHTGALGSPALPGTSAAPSPDRNFQKLSGTVWITNMEYFPGFSNTSSEEYQTFAQLFVDEVHKSLPLEVLQQMDAGLIKVLVTGVTNGTTVVSFNLLVAEDVDVHHVITTFREAFEHSSYFTIDRSSLSMHTFPFSQKATVTDEKPVHSTVLPVTSLQTSTRVSSPASLDFSPAEHEALEDTMFSSTVLPPLTMDPMATLDVSPRASPVPLVKPTQEVSIQDAVSVFCEIERIVLAIQKRFLQQESIPESSLFLGEPGCNVSTSNGTHVVLQAAWSDCGTQVETNMTTTVVKTTLRNEVSAQGIIHHLSIASPIHCVFQNDVLTSSGYTAEGLYTIFEDLHGSGRFRTEMQLFIGNSPIPKNFSVSASEDVLIEVGMQRADSKLKVVLTDCWATPTNNSVDPLSFVFISNSCPIPNTYTTLLENGNSSKAQFKMKIFSFVNNSVVYLHCRIRICMETPGSTCRTRCHARARLLKAGETIALHRTSWGPLCKSAASGMKREKKAGMGIGYIILIALAVFGFVLGVVTLLIFQYQRKMGRYNFRIKSDNFSYQVFYD
ncbi:uromodulin-like 1 [Aphelocoma coerulescens]|uniref:uromodulin-like 1 n=1 Tax=Aphelocoma coerulescens TaxID=39617 RepID=UPI003604664C